MKRENETSEVIDQSTPAVDVAASQRLYKFGLAALVAGIAWFVYKNAGDLNLQTLLGIGIIFLSSLPALNWAARRHTWFPAFEIGMLTCIPFYAVPLLSRHAELAPYPQAILNEAGFLVLLYIGMANIGFQMVRNPGAAPTWAVSSLVPEEAYRHIPVGLAINTVYVYVSCMQHVIPTAYEGTLRAFFFGIGIMCTFILARLLGMGVLSRNTTIFMFVNLTIQVVILFSQLYLISGLSLVILALIAYSAAQRRVPWIFLISFVALLALLHNGKSEMRRIYWEERKIAPTLLELPEFFSEWVGYGLRLDEEKTKDTQTSSSIFDRASLIQMLCLSVDRVPSTLPYLEGESYVDIPAQIIPRFMWPGKPSSLLANVRLALHFNLVSIESAYTVSIAFGMIAESYVNFGYIGVALLGLLFGAGLKRIAQLAQNAPQFSALGILMILLTAWSFQIELVLATWLSSLFQATVVCIGLPLIYRRFTQG